MSRHFHHSRASFSFIPSYPNPNFSLNSTGPTSPACMYCRKSSFNSHALSPSALTATFVSVSLRFFFQPTDSPSSPAFGYTPLSASGGTADSPAYSPSHSVTSPGFSPTSPACKYQERSEVNRRADPPPLPDPNSDPRNPVRPACPCRLAYRFELERSARPNADVGRRRIQSKLEWRRGRVAHIDECGEPTRRWGRKVWPWRIQPDEVGGGKLDSAGMLSLFSFASAERETPVS